MSRRKPRRHRTKLETERLKKSVAGRVAERIEAERERRRREYPVDDLEELIAREIDEENGKFVGTYADEKTTE